MTATKRWAATVGIAVVALIGCKHDHSHGDHPHAQGSEEAADEPEPVAITNWTEHHELFVEFPPPSPGKPVKYHAHVTRLRDFQAVTEGKFTVRFKTSAGVATETSIDGVARAGIFTPEGPAPTEGTYTLEMAYAIDGKTDVFECGKIVISSKPPEGNDEGGGAISFLKESQWKIPFGTAWAEERPMAKEIELPATVEPASGDQLTISAATGGRFFHNRKRTLAEGLNIKKGDIIGTISPTVAGDDFSRLQFAVEDARLERKHTQHELERIEPLVAQGVLPRRRLTELKHELRSQNAKLKSARRRLGRVVAPGGAGGLVMKSTLDGVIAHVMVPNGEPVEPGTPLLRIRGTEHVWIRSRFVARPVSELVDAKPAAARLATGERIDLAGGDARFLSSLPVIDPQTRVATWVVDVEPHVTTQDHAKDKARPNLAIGSSVVLSVRIGTPRTVLAVPTGSVIDINTRPFVFVQVDGESFDKRAVTLGDRDGPFVEVASGLEKGDRIVTVGGFDVHLASLMGAVESHRH